MWPDHYGAYRLEIISAPSKKGLDQFALVTTWNFAHSKVPIVYVFTVLGSGYMCHSSSMKMAMFEVTVKQVMWSMDLNTTESETVGGFAGIHVRP